MKSIIHSVPVKQFIKFGIVGVCNTGIDFIGYVIATRFFGIHYLVANALSWMCAVCFSFAMNRFWTFRATQPGEMPRQYVKFFIVSLISLALSLILLRFLVQVVGVYDIAAKVVIIAIILFWNFFMNKFWTFSS